VKNSKPNFGHGIDNAARVELGGPYLGTLGEPGEELKVNKIKKKQVCLAKADKKGTGKSWGGVQVPETAAQTC